LRDFARSIQKAGESFFHPSHRIVLSSTQPFKLRPAGVASSPDEKRPPGYGRPYLRSIKPICSGSNSNAEGHLAERTRATVVFPTPKAPSIQTIKQLMVPKSASRASLRFDCWIVCPNGKPPGSTCTPIEHVRSHVSHKSATSATRSLRVRHELQSAEATVAPLILHDGFQQMHPPEIRP